MIAVLGANGRIGRHVSAGLAAMGADARALVRRSNGELPIPAVEADLDRPETLPPVLAGAERLFLLTPHGPEQARREAAAIDAAVAAGVRRIVKVSGTAASVGPNGPGATALAHWRGEQRIEQSGLQFTFLRPSFFMQNLLGIAAPAVAKTGILMAPFGRAQIAMVDARDVAASAVAALLSDDTESHAWHLTGPRAVTFPAIAKHVGARHRKVPVSTTVSAMRRRGLPAFELSHAAHMAAFFIAGCDAVVTDHVARLKGSPPRTVEAFLDEHRAAFAPTTSLARILSKKGR
jgi:uncharacterized protein YbjT (DUF2867 family)